VNITDAHAAASRGQATRQKRYAITMAFRTACFVSMIFVPGAFRWVLLGFAVFLPYVAVLFANQADSRSEDAVIEHGEPTEALQVTRGDPAAEIIHGVVVTDDLDEDDEEEERRSA